MYPESAKLTCILLMIMLLAAGGNNAFAGWQAGAGTGYDSNINRSVDNRESDTYLSGYASLIRQPSGESRLGWFGEVTVEGVSFTNNHDLNYAMISSSAGMTCFLHAFWRVDVAPFLEAKTVDDSEQSALAFGGKVSMQQQIKRNIYTGQYYLYRDNRADVETYSFTEHVFGVFLGLNWTEALFTEVYYEFSRGDSFRTISTISINATDSTTSTILSGKGNGQGNSDAPGPFGEKNKRIYSETFGSDVIQEEVDQHAIGVSVGIDWNRSLSSHIGYTFATTDGELGTSKAHAGFLDISCRF
ncbi:MAG: hypothetical protein LWW98_04690 [Deltaproteobacteria bacterium]|nr:hypothetical protein [Deltaproteobacteria bacterium]